MTGHLVARSDRNRPGRLLLATGHAVGASRMEVASGGGMDRGRDLTGEWGSEGFVDREGGGDSGEECLGVGVEGIGEERVGGRLFDDTSEVHDADVL